jgi:hypothetical protein
MLHKVLIFVQQYVPNEQHDLDVYLRKKYEKYRMNLTSKSIKTTTKKQTFKFVHLIN